MSIRAKNGFVFNMSGWGVGGSLKKIKIDMPMYTYIFWATKWWHYRNARTKAPLNLLVLVCMY